MYKIQTRDYAKVSANIIALEKEYSSSTRDSQSVQNAVVYSYTYHKKQYESSRLEFSFIGKKIGDKKEIKCDINNPKNIEDILRIQVYSEIIVICGAFIIFLVKAIRE